jgi:hypothetical protein
MIEVRDIAAEDAAYWANLMKIELQDGVWSFDNRAYLKEDGVDGAYSPTWTDIQALSQRRVILVSDQE